jgi:solute:Na+ symporter, SSS family
MDTLIFWVFTIAYIAITLYLAYIAWKKTKSGDHFLVAGREVSPWIIGLSYGATFISTSAIVGFGGVAAQLGMGVIWLTVLNIGVGILLAFVVFGKPTRRLGKRLNALTFPDLLGKRFRSPFMQYSTSILILVSMPLYSSAVIIGGALFLSTTLSIQYEIALIIFAAITAMYVLFGGLLGVMYTDAFQGILMMVGMTAILILTYVTLGGVTTAHTALTNMSNLVPAGLASQGMTGWTSMPVFGSNIWFTMITTIVMGVGIGVLAQPQLIVRFMTAKDSKALNRAVPIGGVFIIMMTGVAFTVGALTNVYFYRESGKIAQAAAGGNIDNIIPLYINSSMPDIVIVLFMLTLLAAAMSTLSSIFHTMGSAAGHDLWIHLKNRKTKDPYEKISQARSSMTATKLGTGVMIIASVALAFIMPSSIIARATAMFMGICAVAFLPLFTHALFSKRVSLIGAKMSLVSGGLVWLIWTLFVHIKESSVIGISKFIFGKDALLGNPWQVIDPLVIALPVSVAALAIGWFLDSKKSTSEGEVPTEPFHT